MGERMNLSVLALDAYQLTTLAAHAASGRLRHQVSMSVFFRKLPPARNFVVFAGLLPILEWCEGLRLGPAELAFIDAHPLFGPALRRHPESLDALRAIDGFEGELDALPEGTLTFAGTLRTTAGEPLRLPGGGTLSTSTPLLSVRTDLVRAKLLETPWLARVNHMSMVASKAARVVLAANGRPVMEFGQRRTHPAAAVDASYAAWVAGCDATSNVAAEAYYGVPARGTMDHFAIQASVGVGQSVYDAESHFFQGFLDLFEGATVLVDTYDTLRGVRAAARAGGVKLGGVRLDSAVTPELLRQTRALLDEHGARHAKIFVSDGLDEHRVRELAEAGADGFGVGENITCSPDAAKGVGAVAKLTENGYGRATMKVASASGKATLPGPLQVWRTSDHDLLTLADEAGPAGATPLLQPVWRGRAPVSTDHRARPEFAARAREHVGAQLSGLPPRLRALEVDSLAPWPLVASDKLADHTRALAREARADSPNEEHP